MICNVRIPTQASAISSDSQQENKCTFLEMSDYFSSSGPSGVFVWTHSVCVMGGVQHQESAISQSISIKNFSHFSIVVASPTLPAEIKYIHQSG